MKTEISYRESHTRPGKGTEYDEDYAALPWRKYLWSREQVVLDRFLDSYLGGRKINLLDFACGTGRITSFLESRVETSVAVDISKTMLDEARKKLNRTELIWADLTQNNILSGQKFDLITAFRFFLNAEPALRIDVMKTLTSLLAEDGYLIFNNHRNQTSPLIWSRCIYHNRIRKRNIIVMSMREVKELAERAGLEIIRIYPVGLMSLPKVKLPENLNHRIDSLAMKFRFSGALSESPIVVCRHRS